MKKEEVEFWGRLMVGILSVALYVQATNYSPAISFSLLQRCGLDFNKREALRAMFIDLSTSQVEDYIFLPIYLKAEKDQKALDNQLQSTEIKRKMILDRSGETWGDRLGRVVVAVAMGGVTTSLKAGYWDKCRSMSPAASMVVGATTMLICYGAKSLLIDTAMQELRQFIDAKAAALKLKD